MSLLVTVRSNVVKFVSEIISSQNWSPGLDGYAARINIDDATGDGAAAHIIGHASRLDYQYFIRLLW